MIESTKATLPPAAIRMEFTPTATLIAHVRNFVSDFYRSVIEDPDTASRVALATHELLENAAKYSTDGRASLVIQLGQTAASRSATIHLQNRTSAANIDRATAVLRALASSDDPFALYQQEMRRTARTAEGSGLGLMRVGVEGEMQLRWITEGDSFEIIAETRIGETS